RHVRREQRAQPVTVLPARLRLADAVHLHGEIAEAPRLVEIDEQRDHLDIGARRFGADQLAVQLRELAVAALAGAAVAEHRSQAPESVDARLPTEPVPEERAQPARRELRPQRQLAVAEVLEAIHLLLDDVGGLARRAREELVVLEHW